MKKITKILLLSLIFCLGTSSSALAADYVVTATVPFAVPSQAATVQGGTSQSFSTSDVAVSGTCQQSTPAFIISVWRGSSLLGSTVCSAGIYTVSVQLTAGANSIVVRTANVSNIYGPDSSSVLFTYIPPENNNNTNDSNQAIPDNQQSTSTTQTASSSSAIDSDASSCSGYY